MSEVVALLSVLVTVGLYLLGAVCFVGGLIFVGLVTRHWVVR